jgi:hypothetical protein
VPISISRQSIEQYWQAYYYMGTIQSTGVNFFSEFSSPEKKRSDQDSAARAGMVSSPAAAAIFSPASSSMR